MYLIWVIHGGFSLLFFVNKGTFFFHSGNIGACLVITGENHGDAFLFVRTATSAALRGEMLFWTGT